MFVLHWVTNKCRCGKPAEAIKEIQQNKKGDKIHSIEILVLDCKHCGLRYESPRYKAYV
jgi:hypothetical protein